MFLAHFSLTKTTGGSAYWSNTGVCLSTFLCMHKILAHAQHSCACTTLLCMHWMGQGPRPGPKPKNRPPGRTRRCFFVGSWPWALAPPVHAQECCACTKSVVHAQESCACTRILCMHNILFDSYIQINIALKHFHTRLGIFSFIYTYTVD